MRIGGFHDVMNEMWVFACAWMQGMALRFNGVCLERGRRKIDTYIPTHPPIPLFLPMTTFFV